MRRWRSGKPCFFGNHRRMRSVPGIQFLAESAHMQFDRHLLKTQIAGNFLVGMTRAKAAKHFGFALAQLVVERIFDRVCCLHHICRDIRLPKGHETDGVDHAFGPHGFRQEPQGAGIDCLLRNRIGGSAAEDGLCKRLGLGLIA